MKVVATCRTRDEEYNIAKFCNSYRWADKVLIADGGSEDNTKIIASCYPNVEVRDFEDRIISSSGLWRNPYGKHINFLIDWAEEEGADWMIFDDCDCRPNSYLKEDYRSIMKNNRNKDFIYVTRLYLWGEDKHFPKLATPSGKWTPSIWAWRLSSGFRFKEDNPWKTELEFRPKAHERLDLETPPYCLLHYAWPNEEILKKKIEFYTTIKEIANMEHPMKFGGKLEPLPDWAHE
jgi:hypothetical protein